MEPFNLKSDREAGYFDENMNFVFRKNKGEIDNWLANMNETEMEKAIGEAANAVKVFYCYSRPLNASLSSPSFRCDLSLLWNRNRKRKPS